MYHCNACIYIISEQDDIIRSVNEMEPLAHFTHEVIQSGKPEGTSVKRADVIIADLTKLDAVETFGSIVSHRKDEADLIFLADKEQTKLLIEQDAKKKNITDIWTTPLSGRELSFRLLNWQKAYKKDKDAWQTQNYLDSVINCVPHLIWFKNKMGAHMKVNNYFCKAVNKTMEQIQGRGHYYIWDIEPEEYAKGEYICMESEYEVMGKRETCVFDENVKIGDSIRQLKTYKAPLFDLDGSVMGTVGVATDVTQERLYEEMIIKNANTDFLTGLYNRRYVYEYIEQMDEKHITVFCIDLNRFKSINDIYGHQEGDRALVLTAKALQNCMKSSLISRTGGDEFLIVSPGEHTEEEIEATRKMIEKQIDNAYAKEEHFKNISASVGAAYSSEGKKVFDMLIGEADAYMYREKERKRRQARRNTFEFWGRHGEEKTEKEPKQK